MAELRLIHERDDQKADWAFELHGFEGKPLYLIVTPLRKSEEYWETAIGFDVKQARELRDFLEIALRAVDRENPVS